MHDLACGCQDLIHFRVMYPSCWIHTDSNICIYIYRSICLQFVGDSVCVPHITGQGPNIDPLCRNLHGRKGSRWLGLGRVAHPTSNAMEEWSWVCGFQKVDVWCLPFNIPWSISNHALLTVGPLFPAVGKQHETALGGTEVLRGEKLQNIRFIAMLMKALDAWNNSWGCARVKGSFPCAEKGSSWNFHARGPPLSDMKFIGVNLFAVWRVNPPGSKVESGERGGKFSHFLGTNPREWKGGHLKCLKMLASAM